MAKKETGKSFIIRDKIYLAGFLVCAGIPYADAARRFCRKAKVSIGEEDMVIGRHTLGRTLGSTKGSDVLIWFRDAVPGGGVVAHEALHAITHIFEQKNVTLTRSSEECWAYYLDFLVREIGRRLW